MGHARITLKGRGRKALWPGDDQCGGLGHACVKNGPLILSRRVQRKAAAMNRLAIPGNSIGLLVVNARASGAWFIGHGEWSQASCSSTDQASQRRQYSGTDSSSSELSGRYGSRLLKEGKEEQFQRMQAILGVAGTSGSASQSKPVKKVTISIFQSMKYLFGFEYKQDLAAYRVKTLGRELHPLLQQTATFLSEGPQQGPGNPASGQQKAAKKGRAQ